MPIPFGLTNDEITGRGIGTCADIAARPLMLVRTGHGTPPCWAFDGAETLSEF